MGTGNSVSIKEFVTAAKKISNSVSTLNFGALPAREGEFVESKADNESLKEIGWTSVFDFEMGLHEMLG